MLNRPRCPKCDARMIRIRVEPINSTVGMHHLECVRCDFRSRVATLERARPTDGWIIETRAEALQPRLGAPDGLPQLTWSHFVSKPNVWRG
jgi:hypothetical protein